MCVFARGVIDFSQLCDCLNSNKSHLGFASGMALAWHMGVCECSIQVQLILNEVKRREKTTKMDLTILLDEKGELIRNFMPINCAQN